MGFPFTRSNPLPPALPISLCLIVSGCERRPKSGLLTHVSPSSLQLPCPYALTQAGRGSLACTLHLHVALPPQNNRPSNLMRLRYEETLRACHGCVCMFTLWGEHWVPFYCRRLIFSVLICVCVSAVSLSDLSP